MKIQPMLAETGSAKDLERKDWLYERKLDGIRCVSILGEGTTELLSRSGKLINRKFPELTELHHQVGKACILDGEIAGVDFNAIQHRVHVEDSFKIRIALKQWPIIYYVFDILFVEGESVKQQGLIYRKKILNDILVPSSVAMPLEWAYSGEDLFNECLAQGLEGIMAKNVGGLYEEGKRSYSWLKVKNFKEGIFFVCGVTEGENDRSDTFGSLILAKLVEGKLVYVGNVGSGFTHSQLSEILSTLRLYHDDCPFEFKPDTDRPVKFWTRPTMRCEVRYLDMPSMLNGKLRFPSFRKVV